jgi:hypothetical protein
MMGVSFCAQNFGCQIRASKAIRDLSDPLRSIPPRADFKLISHRTRIPASGSGETNDSDCALTPLITKKEITNGG